MTLFEQIVAQILTEDVSIGKINDAIIRKHEVKINYQSETDNASGERIIQPVAYGITKKGKPVIRAYQPFGDTQTTVPSWKFFLVSGIQNWEPMFKNIFDMPPGFNPNGDKTMRTVYVISKFDDASENNITKQPQPVKSSGPVKKSTIQKPQHISVKDNDKVKNLEKLRKQLDNPKYISDIVKNNSFDSNSKEEQNTKMTANSGPVSKDNFKTQTEKDIASRYEQLNKNEKVSQDVLNQWQKEQEKKKNKYGNIRNGNE
jgi:hypothetical protein